jgi:tetratricopeptide (TPR) repeat protein
VTRCCEEALADISRAVELDPGNPGHFAARGRTYQEMKRYEEALADFSRAVELDPGNAGHFAVRGETYRLMGRYEEALADLNRAVELGPGDAWAIGSRGLTYRELGRYEEALADLSRAVELDPSYAWAIAARGVTYRELERYEEALADLNRAVELDPSCAWAIAARGETYRLMECCEEALADFNRAVELDPGDAWAIGRRGQSYQEMERYVEALADLNQAVKLGQYWAIGVRGETYRLMKRYEEALADFDRAVELDPANPGHFAARGQTYQEMDRFEEALADLNRAVELDPSDDWAKAVRGQTYRLMEGYGTALPDEWRVCIAFGDRRQLTSREQPLTRELSRRLGYQVRVSRGVSQIFWYAPSAGSADESAQVAREVLARRAVRGALVRTERWSPRDHEWRDVTDEPPAVIDAELQAVHEYRQGQERERSRQAGFPGWRVRVEVPSHRDVVALAGHLAAQGWPVRRRRRHLFVGADCEDDAKRLVREPGGDLTRAEAGQEPDSSCGGPVTPRSACMPDLGGQTASGGGAHQVVPPGVHEVAVCVHGFSCLREPAGDVPAVGWFHRGRRPA